MKSTLKKSYKKELATSFTFWIFLVVGITGVMMYFHILSKYTKQMHEILGLLVIAVVVFHVLYNWNSMKNYFSKKTFFMASFLTLLVVSGFLIQSSQQGPNPKALVINSLLNAPISQSFEILKIENAHKKLDNMNLFFDETVSIKTLAKQKKISPWELINQLSKP